MNQLELIFNNKKNISEILSSPCNVQFNLNWMADSNKLIMGDNFDVMKLMLNNYMAKSIDLIYIDPPFSTNNVFTIGKDKISTISNGKSDDVAYYDTLKGDEFLEFIRERLILAKELLSDRGSIYLHIDYKIGHYIKLIMDEIFGVSNFKNDITRIKCNPKNFNRDAYGNIKDMILFYTKTEHSIWNNPTMDYTNENKDKLFAKIDVNGRRYTTIPIHAPGETINGATSQPFRGMLPPKGRHWRSSPEELEKLDKAGLIEWSKNGNPRKIIYADEKKGMKAQDIWEYKDPQYPKYPTEKNIDLLKFLINASSLQESIVMDFFCGSGTTLVAAEQLGRRWIGIDKSEHAINVAKNRLHGVGVNNSLFSQNLEVFKIVDSTNVA